MFFIARSACQSGVTGQKHSECCTPVGALNNLGALGWSCDERHYPRYSVLRCQLNNIGYYFPPAPPEKIALSVWEGVLPWGECFWT